MSYRCSVCSDPVESGTPRLVHVLRYQFGPLSGQICGEKAVCLSCKKDLDSGVTYAQLYKTLGKYRAKKHMVRGGPYVTGVVRRQEPPTIAPVPSNGKPVVGQQPKPLLVEIPPKPKASKPKPPPEPKAPRINTMYVRYRVQHILKGTRVGKVAKITLGESRGRGKPKPPTLSYRRTGEDAWQNGEDTKTTSRLIEHVVAETVAWASNDNN